ncbi:hypothetical protein F6X40_10135 [Paraburkholderia sp. UCT31]|uniref:hypothetical protein n=1 Tax=Paraburkholderia sp. UCT31 TaxID=2615209 RepID=UPI001656069A|nr:hypothetical protein [Paraburkholderia sp. UCT31]MBC8737166.1 hypothetical protein [Paraburkholderia sp. UCT31]
MHKISRIYVANTGAPGAWYDGQLIPFTDLVTGAPTHTVYNLTNGGGKTTIISLIFSTLDTDKSRFLQYLGKNKQRFEEYFDKNGTPGFVVLEWALPGVAGGPAQRLVTGQLVVMRGTGDAAEAERFFFSFVATDTLSLDQLPAPTLGETPLRNREDCLKWLGTCQKDYAGNFQYFQQQQQWKENLIGKGIDVDMFRQQVEMNRTEGQQDDTLLNFKSETDFVQKFLAGTLSPETSEGARDVIADLCRKFGSRKSLKESHAQMERLAARFQPFSEAALAHRTAFDERAAVKSEVAVAVATLRAREAERRAVAEDNSMLAGDEQRAADEHANAAQEQSRAAEFYGYVLASRVLDRATETARAADTQKDAAGRRVELIEAAEITSKIQSVQTRIDSLNKLIEETDREITPLRDALGRAAALYREALSQASAAQTEEAAALGRQLDELRAKQRELGEKEKDLRTARETANTELGTLTAQLRQAQARIDRLVKSGALASADETPAQAEERLVATAEALSREIEECEARAQDHAASAVESQQLESGAAGRKASAEAQQRDLGTRVAAGRDTQERLAGLPALCRAAKAPRADADNAALPEALDAYIAALYAALRDAERELHDLNQARRDIADTGLAARDPNVNAVVEKLVQANISGAMAYGDYLSQTVPSADEARALVLSDPSRYLGVAIALDSDIDAARRATEGLKLSRPVTISAYSLSVQQLPDARYVVGPTDDSAFNRGQAQQKAEALDANIDSASEQVELARHAYEEACRAKAQLEQYLATYGGAQLTEMESALNAAVEAVDRETAEIARLRASAQEHRSAEIAARGQSRDIETSRRQVDAFLREIVGVAGEHAAMSGWVQQRDAAALAASTHTEALDAVMAQQQSLAESIDTLREKQLVHIDQARILLDASANVRDAQTDLDAATELAKHPQSLDALKLADASARETLNLAIHGKAADLLASRESAERERASESEKLRARYPESRFPAHEVAAFLDSDFTRALTDAKRERDEAVSRAADANSEKRVAAGELASFVKARRFPDFEDVAAREWCDADLEQQAQEAAARAEGHADDQAAAQARADEAQACAERAQADATRFGEHAENFEAELRGAAVDAEADMTRFGDINALAAEVRKVRQQVNKANDLLGQAELAVRRTYDQVQRLARDESFVKVDLQLAVALRDNTAERAAEDCARLEIAIKNRTDALVSDIESLEGDFDRAVLELGGLVKTSLGLLDRAVNGLVLPKGAPMVGGLPVFKFAQAVVRLTAEQRHTNLRPFLEELAAEPERIPQSGAALAAQAIMRLANGYLGVQFLKMTTLESQRYVPMAKISHSGGESISTALFLYFVMAKLRYEVRADSKTAEGMPVVLDNPLSKATNRQMWDAILRLADAVGMQLLVFTGAQDYEPLSLFKRHIRLAKSKMNPATNRLHVQISDYQFTYDQEERAAA